MSTFATGYAPGHMSCIFQIISDPDLSKMHSLGLGFTVSKGVTVRVVPSSVTEIYFNGVLVDFKPVHTVLGLLDVPDVKVFIETELPLSSGFGVSGASVLATAYAANALYILSLSDYEIGMKAHLAEVSHLTGLSDVCGQFHGGCTVRNVAGTPLESVSLPFLESLYVKRFGPIDTSLVLGSAEKTRLVNKAAASALERISDLLNSSSMPLFSDLVKVSKDFALKSGLLTDERVLAVIRDVEARGGAASMIMLGNAVFSTLPFEGSEKLEIVKEKAGIVYDRCPNYSSEVPFSLIAG